MSTIAKLAVEIGAKTDGLARELRSAKNKVEGFQKGLASKGKALTAGVTAPIAGIAAGMVKSAMDLEATEAKYATVFGEMRGEADEFLDKFQELTPATRAEAKSMASGVQDLLIPMGMARDEATKTTGEFMNVVGALANFNSGTHTASDVTNAFQSAITGEYSSLKQLGINTNKAAVEQEVLNMGLADSKDVITDAMKAEALLNIARENSSDALAAYNKENLDSTTKFKLLKSEVIDTAAELGTTLLPIVNKVLTSTKDLVSKFQNLSDSQKETILKVAGLAAAIGPLLLVFSKTIKTVMAVKKVLLLLGGPVTAVIAVIAALIAIFVHLYKTNEDFRNKVNTLWESIKEKGAIVFEKLGVIITNAMDFIQTVIKRVLEWATEFWDDHGEMITDIVTASMDVLMAVVETALEFIGGVIEFWTKIFEGDWTGAWESLKTTASNLLGGILDIIKNTLALILEIFGVDLDAVTVVFETVFGTITSIATGFKDGVISIFSFVKDGIVGAFSGAAGIVEGIIGGLGNKISGLMEKLGLIDKKQKEYAGTKMTKSQAESAAKSYSQLSQAKKASVTSTKSSGYVSSMAKYYSGGNSGGTQTIRIDLDGKTIAKQTDNYNGDKYLRQGGY